MRIVLATAGIALAATPWLTWYTGFDDAGAYSDDGWTAFTGVSCLVAAAGVAGLAVAAFPTLWSKLPRVVSRLPPLLAVIAFVTVVRHITIGPNDGGPSDPTAAVYGAAGLAAGVAVTSFVAQIRTP